MSDGMQSNGVQSNGMQSSLGAWIDHHVYSVVASLGRMLRRPWATVLTVG